ncbi:MAG: hypothetical protein AAF702_44355 [Chloroflexota bacterium]
MKQFQPLQTATKLGQKLFSRQQQFSAYPSKARTTSSLIIGQPGVGKSRFIETQFIQDVLRGRSLVLIDIHSDLYMNTRAHIAALSLRYPEIRDRVVVLSPTEPEYTTSINPLAPIEGQTPERIALFMTDICIKIWKIDPTTSPRLTWLLTNTFLALVDLGLSMGDFTRWLQDREWRNLHVPQLKNEAVQRYWLHEFPKGDKEAQVYLAPAVNKLGGVLFDPQIRNVLAGESRISIRQIMDEGKILLAYIPTGILGYRSCQLLAGFLIAQIQIAALGRANTQERRQVYVYMDEYHAYATDYIHDILAESRKYGLSLVMAQQYFDQLSETMRSAVINTSGSLIAFRIGYRDARTLVYDMFTDPSFGKSFDEKGTWDELALALANLPPRTFWIRRRGAYRPKRMQTLTMPDPIMSPTMERVIERMLHVSAQKYGIQTKPETTPSLVTPPQKIVIPQAVPEQVDAYRSLTRYQDVIWDA